MFCPSFADKLPAIISISTIISLVYILLRPSLLDLELCQAFNNDRVPAI